MRVTVNPNTDSSGFGYVAAGQYRLRIVGCKEAIGPKAPYLKWEFELVDKNLKSTDGKSNPGHIFENTTLSQEGNSQFMLKRLCEAVGVTWGDFDTDSTIGLELDVVLGVKEYNGVFSNEVKKYIPIKK